MSRLIDADRFLKKLLSLPNLHITTLDMIILVEAEPTVDAVEVVRCMDCKFYIGSNEKCMLIDTRLHFYETDNTWVGDCFCCWGKRKEKNDE